MHRRDLLKAGAGLGVAAAFIQLGLLQPRQAYAARKLEEAFKAAKLDEALKALGAATAAQSGEIVLTVPDIAENGAAVPIEIESKIAGTEMIAILVDKNPHALAAAFHLTSAVEPKVKTRIKMGQSSDVIVLVKAGNQYLVTKKEVKVTLGGCGA